MRRPLKEISRREMGTGSSGARAPIRPPREEAFRRDTQGGCMQALPIRPRTDTKPPGIRVIPL